MVDEKTVKQYKQEFEAKGVEQVKIEFAGGQYGIHTDPSFPKACYAKVWLEGKEKAEQTAIVDKNLRTSEKLIKATWGLVIVTAILVLVTFIKK
ncbi:MAG: hypothetical protein WC532_01460 [Candidatus Omnitrophota bacterium]